MIFLRTSGILYLGTMLFADDILLVAKLKEEPNVKLEELRLALEEKGLRISRTKIDT